MNKELDENEKLLLIAEYAPLRDEVNRTINRMTANELACAAFVFSVILFQFSSENVTSVPDFIVAFFGASLAVVAAFLGQNRSNVFRRHMDQVDLYLQNLEVQFSSRFGWTNHYIKKMERSDRARQAGTRIILWHILQFVSLLNLTLQVASALCIT